MVTAKKRSGPPAEIGDVDLRQVLEHIVQGVIVIDSERRVLTWNDHYQELMGFPEDVLKIGARAETLSLFLARRGDYGAGEPREMVQERFDFLWSGEATRSEFSAHDDRIYDVLAEPTPDNWLVVSYTDITERGLARAELIAHRDQLQDLDRQKHRFFSIIAHDLRSPFNALLGNAQLIAGYGQKLSRARLQEYAQTINDSGEQLLRLLDNLLDWSRSQTGRIAFEPQLLELEPLVAEGLEVLAMSAEQKGIDLNADVDAPAVMADRLMLETVLRNLVNNALGHIPIKLIPKGAGL
jgi:signal transduction histidine kinase